MHPVSPLSRRSFLSTSTAAAGLGLSARSWSRAQGANERVRMGVIGAGGMGRVYEAHHTRIAAKRYAIKVLHAEFALNPELRLRFHREAEAAATISIFGSTEPSLTGPLGSHHQVLRYHVPCSPCFKRECPFGHYDCMTGVTVAQVVAAVNGAVGGEAGEKSGD